MQMSLARLGHLSGSCPSRKEDRSQCPLLLLECQVPLKWRVRPALSGSGLGDSAPQDPVRPPTALPGGQISLLQFTPSVLVPHPPPATFISLLAQGLIAKGRLYVPAGEALGDPGSIHPWPSHMSAPSFAGVLPPWASAQTSQAFQPSFQEAPTLFCRVRSSSERSQTIAIGTGPGLQQGVQYVPAEQKT